MAVLHFIIVIIYRKIINRWRKMKKCFCSYIGRTSIDIASNRVLVTAPQYCINAFDGLFMM